MMPCKIPYTKSQYAAVLERFENATFSFVSVIYPKPGFVSECNLVLIVNYWGSANKQCEEHQVIQISTFIQGKIRFGNTG